MAVPNPEPHTVIMAPRTNSLIVIVAALAALAAIIWAFESDSRIEALPPARERSIEDIDAAEEASRLFLEAFAREHEQRWMAIHWSDSLDAALKSARKSGKPVLVLLSVRETGTQDPGRC